MKCQICLSENIKEIYRLDDCPIFQNKIYSTIELSLDVKKADVNIVHCRECDFIYNDAFSSKLMTYDNEYQNEQANSDAFNTHLNDVLNIIFHKDHKYNKIVEIGCGKGIFLEKMWERGIDAFGFDPAYEGNNPRIIKDYYSAQKFEIKPDLIILRHTLEHIENPHDFLKIIKSAVKYDVDIYIEVPEFNWILDHNAFWDIFYEHCNYFTRQRLESFFLTYESGLLFNGQYQYVIASLGDLTTDNNIASFKSMDIYFYDVLNKYRKLIEQEDNVIIWGAGAKGNTFLNLLDPKKEYIKYVVDINPKKQGKYIAGTGHEIIAPEDISNINVEHVIIMNDNYVDEIIRVIDNKKIKIHILG